MIPFLYETRNALDWTVTPTALSLKQWFKLEDIYKNLINVYVEMKDRQDMHRFGVLRQKSEKLLYGCILLFLLLFIILFPILAFSSLNPTSSLSNIKGGSFFLELSVTNDTNVLNFRIFESQFLEVTMISPLEFKSLQE